MFQHILSRRTQLRLLIRFQLQLIQPQLQHTLPQLQLIRNQPRLTQNQPTKSQHTASLLKKIMYDFVMKFNSVKYHLLFAPTIITATDAIQLRLRS